MNDQISWHVELQVKPDQLDAFRALTSEMVESTRSEVGTLIYERFISDDNQFVHAFERYVDSAAAVMHLIAFGKTYGERFAKMVDRKRFTVFGTPALFGLFAGRAARAKRLMPLALIRRQVPANNRSKD